MSSNEVKEPIFYKVNHRYRDEIIVPIVAIHKFVDFLTTPLRDQNILTTDGIRCSVSKIYTQNLCTLEEKVLSLYRISAPSNTYTKFDRSSGTVECLTGLRRGAA